MKLSAAGFDLIRSFEGYHTALPDGSCKAYLDTLAKPHIWTIRSEEHTSELQSH